MAENVTIIVLGASSMDRQRPSQMLAAESGTPFPALERVGFHPSQAPVLEMALACEDVPISTATDQPFRKTSSS